uniref:Uncharacterized protein n=1 Tax=Pseudo-nitzschia australis TaxID=44445 RepID=A0A6U9W4J5_9STRA|mmetsp:Transcript_446/g.913  ORF Transcript_446/g.913 Transcript_446/m.913 type:complete len:512 (+) Transcript_446:206-1741(+)
MNSTSRKSRNAGFVRSDRRVIAVFFAGAIGFFGPVYFGASFSPEKSIASPVYTSNCRYHRHHQRGRSTAFRRALGQRLEVGLKLGASHDELQRPWKKAIVDYSGANEYIEAHYGSHPSLESTSSTNSSVPYFLRGNSSSDKVEETIYNARKLGTKPKIASNSAGLGSLYHRSLMEKYGMTLVNSPTDVMDWRNIQEIEEVYIQELEKILPSLFSSKIDMHCFWNPMLRGENLELSLPRFQLDNDEKRRKESPNVDDLGDKHSVSISTANVASAVHIDTDVGAYESLNEFLAIVETNQVACQRGLGETLFDRKRYQTAISKDRKRFAVVNFWRNTNRGIPVRNRPLAILSTRYKDDNNGNININTNISYSEKNPTGHISEISAFPNFRPDMERSKWYTFPNMTNDELLVFYQYDRSVTQPSDLWHCAISIDDSRDHEKGVCPNIDSFSKNARGSSPVRVHSPRESFDIRALIVFDEIIPPDKDRFHSERLRPVLSLEESGCFCDEQALARTQ